MTFKEWLFNIDDERLASYLVHEEQEEDWDEDGDGEMVVIGYTQFYITTDGMSFRSEVDAIEHQVALLKETVIEGKEEWEIKW